MKNKMKERLLEYGYSIRDNKLLSEYIKENVNYDLSKTQSTILANRMTKGDIDKHKKNVNDYFYNNLDLLKDIEKLPDMDKAAEILIRHMENNNMIYIVNDFDADGITSGVVLYKALLDVFKIDKRYVRIIVNKRKHGTGYNKTLTQNILDQNAKKQIGVIISSDHGSDGETSYKLFKEAGIDLIITDHHEVPKNNYPESADAFINPQRKDATYHRDVSGCFIAFITMVYAYKTYKGTRCDLSVFNPIIPYVAISTITDVMSLNNPLNRHLVKTGLNEINSLRNRAWVSIKKVLGLPGKVRAKDFGFKIGPLINTGNRVDNEFLAFLTLSETDPDKVYSYATELQKLNAFRKNVQKTVIKETKKEVERSKLKHSVVNVINSDLAINGIVAANIGTAKGLPTVCFLDNDSSDKTKPMTGSCRAIVDGIDLMEIFDNIIEADKNIIVTCGGHKQAAGCAIIRDRIEDFKLLFDKFSKKQLANITISKLVDIDEYIPDYKLTMSLAKSVDMCGPYGKDWEEPIFLTKLKIGRVFLMGSMAKVIFITSNNREVEAMHFFNKKYDITADNIKQRLVPGTPCLVAFNLNVDTFNNAYKLGISIVDITPL